MHGCNALYIIVSSVYMIWHGQTPLGLGLLSLCFMGFGNGAIWVLWGYCSFLELNVMQVSQSKANNTLAEQKFRADILTHSYSVHLHYKYMTHISLTYFFSSCAKHCKLTTHFSSHSHYSPIFALTVIWELVTVWSGDCHKGGSSYTVALVQA